VGYPLVWASPKAAEASRIVTNFMVDFDFALIVMLLIIGRFNGAKDAPIRGEEAGNNTR
jgi:hypothetical protein